MKTGLAALVLLLAISCKKESVSIASFANIKTQDNTAVKTGGHYIGEYFGGGVIFWMSKDSLHGLIADTVDIGQLTWSGGITYNVTTASGTEIGAGRSNTKKIILSLGKGKYAAFACSKYKASGFADWFLPSKDELNELYKQKNAVGNFAIDYYWSSTESDGSQADTQFFGGGVQHTDEKIYYFRVRAVRAF